MFFIGKPGTGRQLPDSPIAFPMSIILGCIFGFVVWFLMRYLVSGIYTVDQNERAVKTIFGRAERIQNLTTLDDPISDVLSADQKKRYSYPQVRVILPGGPYFKWPWEKIHKVSIATETVNMALDPEDSTANYNGTMLEAVTKDQLNTGLTGQIRYRVAERNLYAFLFGVKNPFCPRHGLLRLGAARAHRQLRGTPHAATQTARPTPPRSSASPSTTCARTCAT